MLLGMNFEDKLENSKQLKDYARCVDRTQDTPPWDSAAASTGKVILQSLMHLRNLVDLEITVIITRASLKHGAIPESIFDFDEYFSHVMWHVAKHS